MSTTSTHLRLSSSFVFLGLTLSCSYRKLTLTERSRSVQQRRDTRCGMRVITFPFPGIDLICSSSAPLLCFREKRGLCSPHDRIGTRMLETERRIKKPISVREEKHQATATRRLVDEANRAYHQQDIRHRRRITGDVSLRPVSPETTCDKMRVINTVERLLILPMS
jgi:hypothetical protein